MPLQGEKQRHNRVPTETTASATHFLLDPSRGIPSSRAVSGHLFGFPQNCCEVSGCACPVLLGRRVQHQHRAEVPEQEVPCWSSHCRRWTRCCWPVLEKDDTIAVSGESLSHFSFNLHLQFSLSIFLQSCCSHMG